MISGKVSLSVLSLIALLAVAAPPASSQSGGDDAPARPGPAAAPPAEPPAQTTVEPSAAAAPKAQDAAPPSAPRAPAQPSPGKPGEPRQEPVVGAGSPHQAEQGAAVASPAAAGENKKQGPHNGKAAGREGAPESRAQGAGSKEPRAGQGKPAERTAGNRTGAESTEPQSSALAGQDRLPAALPAPEGHSGLAPESEAPEVGSEGERGGAGAAGTEQLGAYEGAPAGTETPPSGGKEKEAGGPLLAVVLAMILVLIVVIAFAIYRVLDSTRTTTFEAQERSGRKRSDRSPEVARARTGPLEGRQDSPTYRELDAGMDGNATMEARPKNGMETEPAGLRQDVQVLSGKVELLAREIESLRSGPPRNGADPSTSPTLDEKVRALATGFAELDSRIANLERRPAVAVRNDPAAAALQRRIEAVESTLQGLRAACPASPSAEASPDLELELAVLRASWERTVKEVPFLAALGEDPGRGLREELLRDLPRTIEADEELRSACASVLAPVREMENLIRKVSVAQKLVEGTLPPLDQPARQLQRIREGATLLTMLHSSSSFAERLSFRLEQWAGERFLTFADLFLQKRQRALLQGGLPPAALEEGYGIVLRVLAAADLEPLEIVLGRTLFDSAQHVGRSTASQPGLRDGAIAGVVRNGFRQRGGPVVRQPEVVVNRL